MSKMQEIKDKQLKARKEGDSLAAALYTTLLGEAAMIGKNQGNRETTDAECVAVIQKFLKNLQETVAVLVKNAKSTESQEKEMALLKVFLPTQLSEEDLREKAKEWGAASMPEFMKKLKENHAGQYDGKTASAVAKSIFG